MLYKIFKWKQWWKLDGTGVRGLSSGTCSSKKPFVNLVSVSSESLSRLPWLFRCSSVPTVVMILLGLFAWLACQ